MSIVVQFVCGHPTMIISDRFDGAPTCPVCGEARIERVQAPKPRFSGVALPGPCVTGTPQGDKTNG